MRRRSVTARRAADSLAQRMFGNCGSHRWWLFALLAGLPLLAGRDAVYGSDGGLADWQRMLVDEHFQQAPVQPPVREFTAYGGRWTTVDGEVTGGPGPGPKLIWDGVVPATCEVGVELFLPDRSAGNAGLIVRVSQAGEGADAFSGYEISLYADGQYLRLGRHRQNFELLRDVPCEVPVGQWFPLVVRLGERTLEAFVNGRSIVQHEDQQHPLSGRAAGFRPWQRQAGFRNFWIAEAGDKQTIALSPPPPDEPSVCRGWRPVLSGSAEAKFAFQIAGTAAASSGQLVTFVAGQGEVGLAHQGLGGQGLSLVAGQRYYGLLRARSDQPAQLSIAAVSADGRTLAESRSELAPGDWQTLRFELTPSDSDPRGQLAIRLGSPGSVRLNRVWLQPGDEAWPQTLATAGLPPIAFVMRHPLSAPPAVGQDLWAAQPDAPGCRICVFDPARPELPVRTIFDDPQGCIYDMNASYDAQTLFFSYRRQDEKHWHIWRVQSDGSGLQQLTDGPYYDVSPCPLPDGDLVFVSTRRFGYTLCQPGPASNLHRMACDGSRLRCVSMNTLSDMSPQMLPDGRVLFTRWEYIDRDLTYRQSLWTQNPDGTGYQLYFGNTIRDVGTFWQARPLPGSSDRLVATFAPHHGFPHGAIGLIDRSFGVEGAKGQGFVYITQEFPSIQDGRREWAYRDPFPLDERRLLCSYGGGGVNRYRLYLLDIGDRKRLLYEDPELGCYHPLPLQAVEPPSRVTSRIADQDSPPLDSTRDAAMGTCLVTDVYRGLEPAVRRGQVKYLRVMEQVRKTADLASRAYDQSPVMSYGTYYAKRCWGTAVVEEDGSACFRVPALREVYFQALDHEGRELQRMTSAAQFMPGEMLSCVGCHEPRSETPPSAAGLPLAARRPPQELAPPEWAPDGIIDFPNVVQPVLDRFCVRCHSGPAPEGGCDLSGDKTRYFNMAYDNLLGRSRSYRQHDMQTGEMLEAERAKEKPLVHFYWLLHTPTAVNQPLWTGSHASRLPEYLTAEHCEQPISLEDRQRVTMWIDANVPYYGTYAHSRPASPGKRDLCTDPTSGQFSEWFVRDFLGVYDRRCASCHGKWEGTTDWEGRFAWINFTRPENSAALTAHLATAAGGRGIDQMQNGQHPPHFATTDDADYRMLRAAIETGKRAAYQHPEADMPGFPHPRREP